MIKMEGGFAAQSLAFKLAGIGAVCGIAACVLIWIPCIGCLGWIADIAAFGLGVAGLVMYFTGKGGLPPAPAAEGEAPVVPAKDKNVLILSIVAIGLSFLAGVFAIVATIVLSAVMS